MEIILNFAKIGIIIFSRAHKFNSDDDWKMARHLRNKANKLNRSLKKNYCTKAINDNVNNSKMLWNTIKKVNS